MGSAGVAVGALLRVRVASAEREALPQAEALLEEDAEEVKVALGVGVAVAPPPPPLLALLLAEAGSTVPLPPLPPPPPPPLPLPLTLLEPTALPAELALAQPQAVGVRVAEALLLPRSPPPPSPPPALSVGAAEAQLLLLAAPLDDSVALPLPRALTVALTRADEEGDGVPEPLTLARGEALAQSLALGVPPVAHGAAVPLTVVLAGSVARDVNVAGSSEGL